MLTTRQIELLKYLEKREEYTTTKELAEEFSISSRTIRNDLDAIEYSTKDLPIKIERTPRLGIRLEFLEKVGLDSILYTNDMKEYSRDERAVVIAMMLILTDKTTIEQLADQMEVSKNTLVEDLNSVEALFEYYGITLERKSYYGLTISGDEEKIRNMVFNIYLKITKQKTINLDEIIKEYTVIKEEIPEEIIYKIEDNERIKYSDDSVKELKNMILITLNRAFDGFYMGADTGYLRGREKPDNFQIIEEILKREEIQVTEGDILYMIMLLNASKKIKGISLEDTIEDRKIMMPMEELFQKDCCKFNLKISDWKEAVQVAADPLIQYNYIQKEYVDDIIKIIQTIGNYMVFIPEIAFVHAPPEHVNEDHMSLLKLAKPIEFGTKSKVDVKVIIVIASKEENKNLVELMQILMKEDNVAKLKNVTNYDDIREIR